MSAVADVKFEVVNFVTMTVLTDTIPGTTLYHTLNIDTVLAPVYKLTYDAPQRTHWACMASPGVVRLRLL